MNRARGLVLVAVALTIAASCGRKTAVRPPDLVAPEPARELSVANTADGIELHWGRPTRYVDRSPMLDLAGFRIQRRRACCGFREIHEIVLDDRQRFRRAKSFRWTDTGVELGEIYYYQVVAYTVDDYASEPAGPLEIKRILALSGEPTDESE